MFTVSAGRGARQGIWAVLLLAGSLWLAQQASAATAPLGKDPHAEGYKVTEEATAPALKLESARPQVSPSFQLYDLISPHRVSYLLMCNGGCDGLRETLRHVAEWASKYGEFGARAYAFLHHPSGQWPEVKTLRDTFGKEVTFYTDNDLKNLKELMKLYEVDVSPALFVCTQKGFLMGRMTGYSPKDLTDWNDYFNDMFRPLVREKLKNPDGVSHQEPLPQDEENPDEF